MITSFEIGSIFKIIDQATPALKKILKGTTELDQAIAGTRKNLTGLARTQLVGVGNQFKALTKETLAFDKSIIGVAATIGRMGKASAVFSGIRTEIAGMSSAFGALVPEIGGASLAVGALEKEWQGVAFAAGAANREMRAASRVKGPATTALIAGTNTATTSATALADVWRAIAAEVRAAAAGAIRMARATFPGAGAGGALPSRGGRHGPRQGFHVSGVSTPIPGGHAHFRAGGNAAMGGLGAIAYGVMQEAELEDAIFQMKWHAGLPNTPENSKYFRDLIQSTAALTGFGYKDIAEAATDEIRLLKGAEGKESGGLAILPEMLRAAAVEAKLKPGTTLQSAMTSLVEMAHMTQEYGVDDIKGMAPFLAFLSTTQPATMPQMTRAASYAMPTLHSALNMDPADVLFETTAIARAGATNTKSGTWVRAAFERALPPDPNVVGEKEYARRIYAMEKLGLVDANGKSTVLDPTGKHIDIDKFLRVERENADKLSIVERNALEKKVFGEQGSRGLDLMKMPAVMAQTDELKREFPEFKSRYATFFEDYDRESPVQKARETWMDLTNVLSDIGTIVLPPLLVGLRGFDEILKTISSHFPDTAPPAEGTWSGAVRKGLLEGGVAAAVVAVPMAITGVGILPALTAEAVGMVGGVVYEGGKFLLGGTKPSAGFPNAAKPAPSIVPSPSIVPMGGLEFMPMGAGVSPTSTAGSGAPSAPGKVTLNIAPSPPAQVNIAAVPVTLMLDHRTLSEAVLQFVVQNGNGPAQGSPYVDTTRGGSSIDFALI